MAFLFFSILVMNLKIITYSKTSILKDNLMFASLSVQNGINSMEIDYIEYESNNFHFSLLERKISNYFQDISRTFQ